MNTDREEAALHGADTLAAYDSKSIPTRLNREGDTQPMPVKSDQPIIHHLVQADLEARLQLGISRYGHGLQAFNGRKALQDAYEELLDLAVYLKQLPEEVRLAEEASA